MSRIKKALFYMIMVLIILFSVEILLNIFIFIFPNNFSVSPIVDDDILGHRPNPKHPEHDEKGFRNENVPKTTDVVAMGDSQTYGSGVPRDSAWPKQLEGLTKFKVYNMAFGGYGPTHSLVLLDEALKLKPKIVIEAFYSGNDLWDSFNISYYLNDFSHLKTNCNRFVSLIKEQEKIKPLKVKISEVYNFNNNQIGNDKNSERTMLKIKRYLLEHIQLIKLFFILKNQFQKYNIISNHLLWAYRKMDASKYPEDCLILENDKFRTVFTPRYRLAAVDLGDPRILEGLNISLESIRLINRKLNEQGIQFMVILIPTKELVFSEIVAEKNTTNDSARLHYKKLIQFEKRIWEKTKTYLHNKDIFFADALPYFKKQLEKQLQPYDPSTSGHPNPVGHNIIAQMVADELSTFLQSQ